MTGYKNISFEIGVEDSNKNGEKKSCFAKKTMSGKKNCMNGMDSILSWSEKKLL